MKKYQSNNIFYKSSMENFQIKSLDHTAIALMYALRSKYLNNSEQNSQKCLLLLEQKIIYTTIAYIETNRHQTKPIQGVIPDIDELIVSFVQKINKITMENYELQTEEESKNHEKMLNKAIGVLMLSETDKHVRDQQTLKKLKILSFNNLSCVFKKKKKYGVALRAINYAVELEEQIFKNQSGQQKYDMIPTYLNKAAIFSEMSKHNESIQIVLKAKNHIEQIQKQLTVQIERTFDESEKKRLLQKRYYGMYMKMIIFYNMAAEKEHLRLKGEALEFYKQSKQIAIIIDNHLMIAKLEGIIEGIINSRT